MNSLFDETRQPADKKEGGAFTSLGLGGGEVEGAPRRDYEPPAVPETLSDVVRNSGLAYAAGLSLVASVVFMLLVGWFVDLFLGSAPYGVVGGIVLGAVIGFIQFFRLASRIFKK